MSEEMTREEAKAAILRYEAVSNRHDPRAVIHVLAKCALSYLRLLDERDRLREMLSARSDFKWSEFEKLQKQVDLLCEENGNLISQVADLLSRNEKLEAVLVDVDRVFATHEREGLRVHFYHSVIGDVRSVLAAVKGE